VRRRLLLPHRGGRGVARGVRDCRVIKASSRSRASPRAARCAAPETGPWPRSHPSTRRQATIAICRCPGRRTPGTCRQPAQACPRHARSIDPCVHAHPIPSVIPAALWTIAPGRSPLAPTRALKIYGTRPRRRAGLGAWLRWPSCGRSRPSQIPDRFSCLPETERAVSPAHHGPSRAGYAGTRFAVPQ
jgi:hypothetical protein